MQLCGQPTPAGAPPSYQQIQRLAAARRSVAAAATAIASSSSQMPPVRQQFPVLPVSAANPASTAASAAFCYYHAGPGQMPAGQSSTITLPPRLSSAPRNIRPPSTATRASGTTASQPPPLTRCPTRGNVAGGPRSTNAAAAAATGLPHLSQLWLNDVPQVPDTCCGPATSFVGYRPNARSAINSPPRGQQSQNSSPTATAAASAGVQRFSHAGAPRPTYDGSASAFSDVSPRQRMAAPSPSPPPPPPTTTTYAAAHAAAADAVRADAVNAAAHQTAALASVSVASTGPTSSGCVTATSTDIWAELNLHGELVRLMIGQSALIMRTAFAPINQARTHQSLGTLPYVTDAWTRICALTQLLNRVLARNRVYGEYQRRLANCVVDVGSVDWATLRHSRLRVTDCVRRLNLVYAQLQRWKLPDDQAPSDGQLAASAAGVADVMLSLDNQISRILSDLDAAIAVILPSNSYPLDSLAAMVAGRHARTSGEVLPIHQQSADNVADNVASRFTPSDGCDQLRLSSGSEERRIASTLMDNDVDRLLSSASDPSPRSRRISCNGDPQPETLAAADPAVQPFFVGGSNGDPQAPPWIVIAPMDTTDADEGLSTSAAEIKYSSMMSTDGRQHRTRRTDLGTIDLDPDIMDDDDNHDNTGRLGLDDICVPSTGPDDVFVAPAVNLAASDNNFGLFVQFSSPTAANLPTAPPAERYDGHVTADDVEAWSVCISRKSNPLSCQSSETESFEGQASRTPSSSAATDFDVKPFVSLQALLQNDDLEGHASRTLTPASYCSTTEHSNADQAEAVVPDVVCSQSTTPDEFVDTEAGGQGAADVRWHLPQKLEGLASCGVPEDIIHFALPTACEKLDFSSRKPEARKQEPVPCGQSADADSDDSRDDVVVMIEQPGSTSPSSEPPVVVSDTEDEAFCQIVNVYSLSPQQVSPLSSTFLIMM